MTDSRRARSTGIAALVLLVALAALAAVAPPGMWATGLHQETAQRPTPSAPKPRDPAAAIARLLTRLETVIASGRPDLFLDLTFISASRERAVDASAMLVGPGITRVAVRERDRVALANVPSGEGFRIVAEIFAERGVRASLATWQLDLRLNRSGPDEDDWRIADQTQLSTLDGLFKPFLNPAKQLRVRNLVVKSEDLEITMASGRMFVAETAGAPTVAVLLPEAGERMTFAPTPDTERGQVRLFCGASRIEDRFGAVFVRVNPADFDARVLGDAVTPEPVDSALFRKAQNIFTEDIGKSFNLDLGDLSAEAWTFVPNAGDLLLEMHTRRFGALTYTNVANDSEDISVFDRSKHRNICVYRSQARAARDGRFFNEDDGAPYAITQTELNVTFDPDRFGIDGVARLRLRVREGALNSFSLRLSEALTLRAIASPEYGRLIALRVRNQNSMVVTLPSYVMRGTEFTLLVSYSGRLVPPPPDRETVHVSAQQDPSLVQDEFRPQGESHILYSTNSVWYPQSPVPSHGTAHLRLTVPAKFQLLASGRLSDGFPRQVVQTPGKPQAVEYDFDAAKPLRYLSCVISKFVPVASADVSNAYAGGGDAGHTRLSVETNPRLQSRGRDVLPLAENVMRFYRALVGDLPYPGLTIGLVEDELPGGHSPAYLSVLNEPLPSSPFNWGNDPAYFPNYPEFFLAHEVAHQWFGQAVGFRSYHERWISEGFSQFFAALFAKELRGENTFNDLMRRMAKWGMEESDHGPISLGYRLGHIEGDSRIFRALAYNKAAVVLDMLRRRLGDETFFGGLRRFYREWRFKKAGTDDVRKAFEAESGENLEAYFEGWFHTAVIPIVKASWTLDGTAPGIVAIVRLDQTGPVMEYPVTVSLKCTDDSTVRTLVQMKDRSAEVHVPLGSRPKALTVNADGLTMVVVARQ